MLDADRSGPRDAALWLLGSITLRPDSVSLSAEALADLAGRHGFTTVTSQVLIPEITKLLVVRAPGGAVPA